MELVRLGPNTWYIPGKVNIGFYEENGRGYLIDSGLDESQGRKILKLLEAEGRAPLRAIVNTHSHADHIGANAFLQKRTNCEVWITHVEGLLTDCTMLEPLFLWSAWPFEEIRGKFLEAQPSAVSFIASEGSIRDTGLTAMPLPGHSLDMIGIRTPDNVLFLADALVDPSIIEKYRFTVMLDVDGAYRTLDAIEGTDAEWFIPCHAPAVRDVHELTQSNREGLLWVTESVYGALSEPLTREEILSRISLDNGLEMDTTHLLLNLASVSAHLTFLAGKDRVEPFVKDCRLLWRRKRVA